MKYPVILAIVAALAIGGLFASREVTAGLGPTNHALKGEMVFNSGVFYGTGQLHWFHYTNVDSFTKYFKSFSMMMGVDMGGKADFACNLVSYFDGENWIASTGWDHYLDPSAPGVTTYSFFDDYYELGPGQEMHMACHYVPISGNPGAIAQVIGRYVK